MRGCVISIRSVLKRIAFPAFLIGIAGCGPSLPHSDLESTLPDVVDYNFHVKPILSDRCYACHGPDDDARVTDFRMDTEAGVRTRLIESRRKFAFVAGSLGKSEAAHRLTSSDPEYRMPPPESNLSVSPEEVAIILKWIKQGAEFKPHWSLIPPQKPTLPQVSRPDWPANGIDYFVLHRLDQEDLHPQSPADREMLIRRVTFDLTGLPPTLSEIDAFLADTSAQAYEKVVDRLLSSPAYGERMATEWLDVARYADSHGYQDDGLRNMWPWRDWVIESFNENQPFDEFVTWQLAGDLLPDPSIKQRLATGFNRNHLQSQEGGIVPEEYRIDYVADRTNTFGKAFLGLTLECARCHDHKFDPVSQEEYYQLFDFFNSVNEFGTSPYFGVASPTVILIEEEEQQTLDSLHARIDSLEARVATDHPAYDEDFARWLSSFDANLTPIAPQGLVGHYPLDGFEKTTDTTGTETYHLENRVEPDKRARFFGDIDKLPLVESGQKASALRMQGDGHLDMGTNLYYFERNEPFSISLWFNVPEIPEQMPLFAKAIGLGHGRLGYVCVLEEDGTIEVSLNHTYPDNSIIIRSQEAVPTGEWVHIVMTYDGSSRATGLALYMNGEPMASSVTTDNLRQSILFTFNQTTGEPIPRPQAGNLYIGYMGPTLPRLEGVLVDEFQIYNRRLTALEVAEVHRSNSGSTPERLDLAADRSALRDYYVTTISSQYAEEFRELTAVRAKENEIISMLPEVMVMRDLPEPRPTYVLDRGQYDAPMEQVSRATPVSVMPFSEELPMHRGGLAEWLTDPGNPLFARVTVNRYWQMYFGNGLVSTPDDFGSQGSLPSHPDLLDWLATSFVETAWDVKALQRLIVTSSTYRQSSVADSDLQEKDPDNVLLARGAAHRLPAEMMRDNALAASGLLVDRIGGPPVKPYQPEGLWKELATRNATEYQQDSGENLYRRSMYTIWKRTTPPPSMMTFDASERNTCTVLRQTTSTPLQALVLLNDPQYVEAARALAGRLKSASPGEISDQLTQGYRVLTGFFPEAETLQRLRRHYEEELESFAEDKESAMQLLSVGDFPDEPAQDPTQLAALTVVISTVMNSDAAVMKR